MENQPQQWIPPPEKPSIFKSKLLHIISLLLAVMLFTLHIQAIQVLMLEV